MAGPNLEQLRKQAKELVRAARAGDEAALARIAGPADRSVRLADAQRALAREHGYGGWAALVHDLEARHGSRADRHRRFVEAATLDQRAARARALIAADPSLGDGALDVALLLGEVERVRAAVDRDPALVREPVGVRRWVPLLYASHSCFLRDPERAAGLRACARLLLAAGADPNATAPSPDWPGSTWTPLFGAAGRAHDPELTRLLLEAGADPDDNESLYHATETGDHACLRLLLEAGATVDGTNALPHMLDREDVEGARLLLDAGASQGQGPEGSALLHAIARDRSPAVVRLLLERGADVEAYGPDGRTAYAGAVLNGRDDLVPLLVAAGARPEASAVDAFAGAVVRGDDDAARRVLQAEPGLRERLDARARAAVVAAAMRRGAAGADLLVELGLGVDLPGWSGGTALHQAAWLGLADAVAAYLARGADPRAESGMEFSTPLAWAVHGSIHCEGGDHVAVAELLVAAGAEIEPRFPDAANEELAAWLAEAADGRTG